MLDRMTTAPEHPEHPEHDQHDDKHRLTAVQGLAALSLDALSSVAYGPEAILVVLVVAGAAGLRYSLPITGAIIILLVALVVSYRQVIAAFPGGGGAYAVAKAHLGTRASLVAAASLLALAANTSFGGLPVLAALLAKDNFLPHMFGLRADRQVHRYGVITLALLAAALLVAAKGDTQALVPLFAIGVFVGFTLSQVGMVRHWRTERSDGWIARAAMNGAGALLTAATTLIELVSKFTEGAWLIVLVIPGLVLLFSRIHHTYQGIGALLELGKTPKPPARKKSLVVVPVASISRLTAAGISTALSIGDDVTAVKVCFTDPEDEAADEEFRRRWEEWHPNVPLVTLRTAHRSIAQPIVKYLTRIEAEERYHQLVVLIPEVQPPRFWDYLLFNRRGAILERAIRRGTANVVLCRLHYRLEHFTPGPGRQAPVSRSQSLDDDLACEGQDGEQRVAR